MIAAASVEQVAEFVPQQWALWLVPLIPLITLVLTAARAGATTSAQKALTAVALSTVLTVLETLTDGTPDTLQSILLTAWVFAIGQLTTYELIWKRVFDALSLNDDTGAE